MHFEIASPAHTLKLQEPAHTLKLQEPAHTLKLQAPAHTISGTWREGSFTEDSERYVQTGSESREL
jgi:hypothetical protein